MTRKEEIKEMAEITASHITSDKDMQVAFADALRRGAEWADTHPHWISVEEELPKFFDIVLYCDEDGNYYTDTDNIGDDVEITHWMHIPDCPPLQNFGDKLRKALNETIEKGDEL